MSADLSLAALRDTLRSHGVVGAGGAGYPAWAKLSPCADLILNGAESEPLCSAHSQLLARHPREVLLALNVLAKAMNARPHVAVGIQHPVALEAVRACLASFPETRVPVLPDVYPAGDEVMVVYACLNKVTPPGRKPCDVGAAVFNVETVYNAYRALQFGAPVLEKYVTLAGAFARPATLRVPLGTPFSALAEAAGGMPEGAALLRGGPLSGKLAAPSDVVTKTTNAVLALPETHPIVRRQRTRVPAQYLRARAACCQCGMCTALCPRRLIGYPIKPHAFVRAAGHGVTDRPDAYVQALYCSRCGLCEAFACGQGLSPRALLSSAALSLLRAGVAAPEVESPEPLPERAMRGVSLERLTGRLDLKRYAKPAPYQPGGVRVSTLFLPLSMHAGPPSVPVVAVGQAVSRGDLVAEAEGVGVPIHAPLDGRIAQVTDAGILLEGGDGLG